MSLLEIRTEVYLGKIKMLFLDKDLATLLQYLPRKFTEREACCAGGCEK